MKWIERQTKRQTSFSYESTPPALPAREWRWVWCTSHSSHRGSSMYLSCRLCSFISTTTGVKRAQPRGGIAQQLINWFRDGIQLSHADRNVVFLNRKAANNTCRRSSDNLFKCHSAHIEETRLSLSKCTHSLVQIRTQKGRILESAGQM